MDCHSIVYRKYEYLASLRSTLYNCQKLAEG